MRASERPLSAVPTWIVFGLIVLFSLQIGQRTLFHRKITVQATRLPTPPSLNIMRLGTFGEPEVLSKLIILWLQAFDNQSGISIPFDDLDYDRVIGWLEICMNLDRKSQYPMFVASHLYSRVNNPDKQRAMIGFIEHQFSQDPKRHWRWLAHAVVIAQHRLNDLGLARRLAKTLRESATGEHIPHWAQQMELGIMEMQGEYHSAAILIGGLLRSGQITDPHELRFLDQRLKDLKKKTPVADLDSTGNSSR